MSEHCNGNVALETAVESIVRRFRTIPQSAHERPAGSPTVYAR